MLAQGEGKIGKGGDDEAESGYLGADVVELVNLRDDTTTVYKLADGTNMDCIEHRFIYNGTDTWTDEDGGVEIVSFENVNITYPEHTHIELYVISGVKFSKL